MNGLEAAAINDLKNLSLHNSTPATWFISLPFIRSMQNTPLPLFWRLAFEFSSNIKGSHIFIHFHLRPARPALIPTYKLIARRMEL